MGLGGLARDESIHAPRQSHLPATGRTAGILRTGLLAAALLGLEGCATTHYYWQAVRGHLDLMSRRRPIPEVIADPATPPALRSRLATVIRLRQFAVTDLGLPDNGSYRSYAALGRPYVAWNVFAADPFSVTPREWCFPIAGCVVYRGYFARQDADAEAGVLRAQGDDVYVGGVPAYSTLGWFDDPVLSTFMHWPEVEIARLLFHELGHQMAYAPGDTAFNEAFATAVEEEGVRRWIAHDGRPALAQSWQVSQTHRRGFQQLVLAARADLAELYASDATPAAKRAGKAARLSRLQADYQTLKAEWGGFGGFDHWFGADVNNAQLASLAVYTQLVPAFLALLHEDGDDLPRFYRRVLALTHVDADARRQALELAIKNRPPDPPANPPEASAADSERGPARAP